MLHAAVAISVVLGFVSTEFLGLLSGGIVSAGYLAFYLEQPFRIVSTLLLSIITAYAVKGLSHFMIIYGRRRFMLTVLLSIIFSSILEKSFYLVAPFGQDIRVIGYIIPGLIANDIQKQGVFKTILTVLVIALLIYLFMHLGIIQ